MVPSPNSKEILFIYRGDVFATTIEGKLTRRLTKTPEQERHLDISPDGRTIVYASERNNSWNLYTLKLTNKDESYFTSAIELKEEALLDSEKETFQPKFSPTGKEIAYLEDRIKLRTINLESKTITKIHNGELNFSYVDGDQNFEWSPDGKWFAITFYPKGYWFGEIGIISANGDGKINNISQSGFSDSNPKWSKDGSLLYWFSNKSGMHSVAKTGPTENDVYGAFLTQTAFDKYKLPKDEFELLSKPKKENSTKEEKNPKGKNKNTKKDSAKIKPITIDFDYIQKRKVKLSLFSSRLSEALLTTDSKSLIFLGRADNKTNLWKLDLRTKEIKSLAKFGSGGQMAFDKESKKI